MDTKRLPALRRRQLLAAGKIAAMAASVSNEDIQDEIDSLFANINSACLLIEQTIEREARTTGGTANE